LSDEVELYHRTYSTLLRSSGETLLRVLEPAHRAMGSSLHLLADAAEPDLGAFLYATRRLPQGIHAARVVVMGQERAAFTRHGIGPLEDWRVVEAPARRRRWYVAEPTFAVMLSSTSDLDDLLPTLVAYQIEWNKLHARLDGLDLPDGEPAPEWCAAQLGGADNDWARLGTAWRPGGLATFLRAVAAGELNLRIRMLGGSQVGYARMTRRWFEPIRACLAEHGLDDRPLYFVSSNTHSLVNLVTASARTREQEITSWVRDQGPSQLRAELERFEAGGHKASWENFLYYCARLFFDAQPKESATWQRRRADEASVGVVHLSSQTALRVSAQLIALDRLDAAGLDPRLADADPGASDAVILNIEYPLGLAAYHVLREVAESTDALEGVYVLGKAATLNADVGDVLISDVIHDEHSASTYWLNNAFSFDDIAPFLVFGSGLDNQRAVTVKSTFLQNRAYLDFYYQEAFTVVEMEAGPYCDAVAEIADAGRYPVGEAVNFAKLPIDFGVIHYASDTPYTQARTLGARGLDYYGMDSTYASAVAILRRVLSLEGALPGRAMP
jgi:hypothetical protein